MAQSITHRRVPEVKRLFDLFITLPGLLVVSPLMAIIALLIRLFDGPPVIFHQVRAGLGNQLFKVYKFRTMRDTKDENGFLLPDEQRISRIGRFLRATSLDELPELFNIVRGEMSLVGPRPLLAVYLQRYSAEQARRHEVLPGITGWAQINGRNALSWEDKFEMDVWYVDHWSFWLDIKILFLTFWKAFIKQEGINQPGEATAKEFMGSEVTVEDNERP